MVEKNNSENNSSKDDFILDDIYLHHKNRHFKHNSFIGYCIQQIDKKRNNKQILKTNKIGLRCEEIDLIEKTNTILLGGSVAFSSFATTEDQTISSLLEKNSNKKIINCGVGGHIFKQHLSLYFNYLKNIETKNIIILFGFNDLVNCYLGRKYDEILNIEFSSKVQDNYLSPIKTSLKTLVIQILEKIGLRNFTHDLLLSQNQEKVNKGIDEIEINNYINKIKKDINYFNSYCNKFNINLIISLQPSIYNSKKDFSEYEKKNLNLYLSKFPQRYKFIKIFNNFLHEELSSFKNYYNLENIFQDTSETIFFDEVHLNDKGNYILANFYKKLLD